MIVDYFVQGKPIPQPRADARVDEVTDPLTGRTRHHARLFRKSTQPVNGYREAVTLGFRMARPRGWPLDGAYRLLVLLLIQPPKSLAAKHQAAGVCCPVLPDGDNYLKAVKDSLKGEAWPDDGRVYDARVVKRYVTPGERPGTRVMISAEPLRAAVVDRNVVAAFLGKAALVAV